MAQFDPKKTIFLIDGSSILYRGYYGVRPLHTAKGVPIHAIYNFCRTIKKLIDKFGTEYITVVWDSKGKTTRHEIYEEYKATRQAPPSDLFDQKAKIVEFCDLIGITQVAQKGIEADDLMYSIAQEVTKKDFTAVFVTSDKDMGQALTDKIFMYDSFKDLVINPQKLEEKMEFPVQKIPFYFSLLGDVSDNIPGVRGIGKKTAIQLVQTYDSLEHLYEHIDGVKPPRAQKALVEQKENAFLSKKLFLLQYHPTELTPSDLAFDIRDWPKARPIFEELEFKTMIKDLQENKGEASVEEKIALLKKYDFRAVTTTEQLDTLCKELKEKKVFALDTETDGLRPLQSALVGISFCTQEGTAYYVPCGHNTGELQLPLEQVVAALKPILEDEQYKKYLHNAKFDQLILFSHGIELRGIIFDSIIAANLVTKEWQRINLKALSVYYLDEPMLTFEEMVKAHKLKDFSYVPLEAATLYSANDSHQTFRISKIFMQELKKEKMETLYNTIELPLIQVLYEMEREGIYLDAAVLQKLGVQVDKELQTIEDQIFALVGEEGTAINLNSPKQVEDLLFYILKLPPQKKRAKGAGYSTDQEVLAILAEMHPVPGLILKHRELFKLKSTYIGALPGYINPKTKRVHTTFRQFDVATGRLASASPNLQNIPAGGASGYGIQIRTAFKPKEGNVFLSADYSQIELRVLAYLSQDKNLVNAFLEGHDIHKQTAARLFDVPLDKVSHDQRQIGKRINFSILYGLTPFGLSKDLGIPFKDSKQYIEKYFEQYPGVSAWMETVVEETKERGYTATHWGRRRYVPGIYEKNRMLYEEARRIAINTVAQGTAAEIMKQGMIALDKAFVQHTINAKILLQIHDELLIPVAQDQQEAAEGLTKSLLESVVDWNVPLVVTTRIGHDWKEITK